MRGARRTIPTETAKGKKKRSRFSFKVKLESEYRTSRLMQLERNAGEYISCQKQRAFKSGGRQNGGGGGFKN